MAEFLYSKENFTFAALPQYVQEDWKRISAYNSFTEIETAFKQIIGNPITNFIYDWFFNEIVKSFSNPATLDDKFLKIAVKYEVSSLETATYHLMIKIYSLLQMLSILTKLETEDSNAIWDLFSSQGASSDGILLFYALFKSTFDSSGRS